MTIIYYFQKSFKFFIKVKIKQQDQASINFKKIVQRAVNIKAKISLRSSIIVWDLDIYYFKDHYLSYSISSKVPIQNSNNKNFSCSKNPKFKNLNLILLYDNIAIKPDKKKDKKDKKKMFRRQRQKYIEKRKKKILAININITKAILKKS